MDDAVAQILRFNRGRDPERLQRKYAAMRRDAFSFLRASCHLFYQRLPPAALLRDAPGAWCCGDLHLENFGSYQSASGLACFDINDFDEASLAPLSWDLLRFSASVIVGAQGLGLAATDASSLCMAFLDAYADTLAGGKGGWVEQAGAGGQVKLLLEKVAGRSRAALLERRTTGKRGARRLLIDATKTLAASADDRARVGTLLRHYDHRQDRPGYFEPLDVARRIAGTASLGLERFVILVAGRGADGNFLLDLKLAQASSLASPLPQPRWKSQPLRIVTLQNRLQAQDIAFLQPLGRYVLRALLPSEDRIGRARALDLPTMRTMGMLAASAHLRGAGRDGSAIADALVGFGRQKRWRTTLLALARKSSAQLMLDWESYCTAYDSGALSLDATA
ncbi:MAG: DUF2252 family protein [Pseudomonadota bacterium]